MTGGVEGGDWWVERMDKDCECIEGEGVMIGGGSGRVRKLVGVMRGRGKWGG